MSERKLKPINDEEGRFTGTYECSECGWAFKPKSPDEGELVRSFNEHQQLAHPKKNPREDVNQTAARIVREATED